MLPLDKMNNYAVSHKVLQAAQKLVGSKNVWRAIDLINFDNRLEPAMNFIFGGVLVCRDIEMANKVRRFLCLSCQKEKSARIDDRLRFHALFSVRNRRKKSTEKLIYQKNRADLSLSNFSPPVVQFSHDGFF